MTLSGVHKATDQTFIITGIYEMADENDIYYVSAKYDPRNMSKELLTLMIDGNQLIKAPKLEFDKRLFRNVRLY